MNELIPEEISNVEFTAAEKEKIITNFLKALKSSKVACTSLIQEIQERQRKIDQLRLKIDSLRMVSFKPYVQEIINKEIAILSEAEQEAINHTRDMDQYRVRLENEARIERKLLQRMCPHPDQLLQDRIVHPHKGEEWADCSLCGATV